MQQNETLNKRRPRPNRIDGEKLVVRLARPKEEDWLAKNHELFLEPPIALGLIPSKERRPVFILLKGREIIGYRGFTLIHDASGPISAHGSGMSIRKGYERRGLGQLLDGRSKALLHKLGYNGLQITARNIDAKRFWKRQGYHPVNGKKMTEHGSTNFYLNLRKEREKSRANKLKLGRRVRG